MKLLEPLKVGNIQLKNRIMFPPLTTGYEGRDGSITSQSRAFYTRLAKGGVGYIVLGDVNPIRSFSPTPRLYEESQVASFKDLADSVHQHGAKLGVQIFHPEYDVDAIGALAAQGKMNEIREKMHHDMLHFTDEVTEDMLLKILDKIVACAVLAEKAGIDAIQVHGDRLLGALCSTQMNHRTDKFGGSLENRTRYALMVVKALKKAVPNMVIDYKLSVVTPERGKGGVDRKDAVQFAKWLEEAGVDMLHVAQANHTGNMADTIPPMGVQPYGFFVDIAAEVKKAVNIPVSVVGRIVDAKMAESILEGEKADIISIGRGLLADPDWGNKIAAGKADSIRRCMYCNKGCTDAIQNRSFLSCVLNAENGYEETRAITPANEKKNVVIVGGGIAGLEAARVAAIKGHKVTLFEKDEVLGGQINLASVPPRKREVARAIADLTQAVKEYEVDLRIGESADEGKIMAVNPDAVIIATGAECFIPKISGYDNKNVVDAWKVLKGEENVFGKVTVVGGGLVGCETAEYLAAEGCKVTIVEMLDKIATGESATVLPTLLEEFKNYGVEVLTKAKVMEITRNSVKVETEEGAKEIEADYIVMAVGAKPVSFDTTEIEKAGINVTRIGDCAEKAADISNAIRTAYDAANSI